MALSVPFWYYQAAYPWVTTKDGILTDQSRIWLQQLFRAVQAAGGGAFTAGCDLSGSDTCQTVIGLQRHAVSTIAPTEAANTVYAGPISGIATIPTFRALASADLPLASTSAAGAVQPDGTTITISGGIISAAGGSAGPALRGSGIQASSAGSYTVSWPSGTIAGDFAIIFAGHGYTVTVPTGWTSVDSQTGSNWNGYAFSRVLNGTDITTGSVTVSVGGTFDGALAIATMVGPAVVRSLVSQRNSSGSSSITLHTDGSPQTSDYMLYFGSNRGASTNTVSLGTNLRQANDGSAASGCLFGGAPAAGGGVSPVYSYSVAGSGNYQIAVAVKGP